MIMLPSFRRLLRRGLGARNFFREHSRPSIWQVLVFSQTKIGLPIYRCSNCNPDPTQAHTEQTQAIPLPERCWSSRYSISECNDWGGSCSSKEKTFPVHIVNDLTLQRYPL